MKNTILSILIKIALVLSLTGCLGNFLSDKDQSSVEDSFDNDGSPTVLLEFDELSPITSINVDDYPMSGRCDPARGQVTVTIGTVGTVGTVEKTFDCDEAGRFSGPMDVSEVPVTESPVNVQVSQGSLMASLEGDRALINDQEGPESAPIATPPESVVPTSIDDGASLSYELAIDCTEAGEIVQISGSGIEANQIHTCSSANSEETFTLTLISDEEFSSPNNLTLSSTDKYGNPAQATTTVNVPIDTQGPRITITNGGNVIQGQTTSFTISITDENEASSYDYNVNTSGVETASYNCTANPCDITTSMILVSGDVVLTVISESVPDELGNTGDTEDKTSTVNAVAAGPLGFDPLTTVNTLNKASYAVSGVCDSGLGDVTISVNSTLSETAACTSSAFSTNMDLISVVSSLSLNFTVSQGAKTENASPTPINDQTPISHAPSIADQTFSLGTSKTISVTCNEANEILSFSGTGLVDSQTYTCAGTTSESVTLNLVSGTETGSTNEITVSSKDSSGNPTTNDSTFILPIDNIAPTVSIAAGPTVAVGGEATFTITITDQNLNANFTPTTSSGTVTSGACTTASCPVTVTGFNSGSLTLTVATGEVTDLAGNTNGVMASVNLTVSASDLSVSSLPMATSLNAANYTVSGNCESTQGDVTVTVGTPNVTQTGVSCSGGNYSTTVNINSVTSSPLVVTVTQSTNTVNPSSPPENDQIPISHAPSIADQTFSLGTSKTISVTCNEANEILSFFWDRISRLTDLYLCRNHLRVSDFKFGQWNRDRIYK